ADWHTGSTIDPPDASVTVEREGQPIETSSGAAEGWVDTDNLHAVDLDEVAPIIHQAPCSDEYFAPTSAADMEEEVPTSLAEVVAELAKTVEPDTPPAKKSSGLLILLTTLSVIGALVYVYFRYFMR